MPQHNRFIKTETGFERETLGDIQQETVTPTGRTEALLPSSVAVEGDSLLPEPTQNPFDNFNLLLLDALKKSQGMGTVELRQKQRALQRASLGRASEITPEGLRTLSPEQQESIRTGKTGALRPDIDENAFALAKAEQSIANFEKVFFESSKLGEEFAKNMVAPDSVLQSYKLAIESNPDNLQLLLSNVNDKTRQKILEILDFSKLAKQNTFQTSEVDGALIQFELDPNGKIVNQEVIRKAVNTFEIRQVGNDLVEYELDKNGKVIDQRVVTEGEATAAGFTLGTGQQRFDTEGNLVASGPISATKETGFTLGTGQKRFDAQGNLIAEGLPKETGEEVFSSKDLPGNLRSEIIDDLQDKEFAKKEGEITLVDLAKAYPEVEVETLRELMEFYDFEELIAEEDTDTPPWWQFWK